jgi:hypothetical protein
VNSITTSEHYNADLKSRRLFATMRDNTQLIEKQIEQIIGVAAGMRRNLANTLLALGEMEALFVGNTDARRKSDAELHAAQTILNDTLNGQLVQAEEAKQAVDKRAQTVKSICDQASRVLNDRFIRDDSTADLVDDVEYVDAAWIAEQLGVTKVQVARLVEKTALPPHDALDRSNRGRPKPVWVKPSVMAAINKRRAPQVV